MSKKKIQLTEKQLKKVVNKLVKEELPEKEFDRKLSRYRQSSFDAYPREKQIANIFGPYRDDIPPAAIDYMRKNPKDVIQKLGDIYGKDKILDYLGLK